jgi:hypothetical protein
MTTLYELVTLVKRKYMEMMKQGRKDRVDGYIMFLNVVMNDVKGSLIGITEADVLQTVHIVFEREISVGDVYSVTESKRNGMKIINNDEDYDRVSTLVGIIRP